MTRLRPDHDFPTGPDGSYDRDRFDAETRKESTRMVHDFSNPMSMGEQLLLNAVEQAEPPQQIRPERWRKFVISLRVLDDQGRLEPLAEQIAHLKDEFWRGQEVTDEDLLLRVPDAKIVPDLPALAALASLDLHFPFQPIRHGSDRQL